MNRRTLLFLISLLIPWQVAAEKKQLIFSIPPFLNPTTLVKRCAPLMEYLTDKTGFHIQINITHNYQTHIKQIGEDRVDFAYLGPVPYVRTVETYGIKPILAQLQIQGKPWLKGVIIARRDSKLENLAELEGKRFAFGDPNSTMNHIVPLWMLHERKINLGSYEYVANHENVALGVLTGLFDAGAMRESIFHQYETRGLKVFAYTPPIASHVFIARNGLPEEILLSLQKSLFSLQNYTYGLVILQAFEPTATGLTQGNDEHFNGLRDILKTLNK